MLRLLPLFALVLVTVLVFASQLVAARAGRFTC